jgi:hypothetical protein
MQNDSTQQKECIRDLNRSYGWDLAENLSLEEALVLLEERLNTLIRDDFSGLVQLLYRIDIDESQLRKLLHLNKGKDAGKIIARLILERQYQKILTRRQYQAGDPATDEERW